MVLLGISPVFVLNVRAQSSSSYSNPSVISGTSAPLNGPRVSAIKYPIFTSDSASLGSVISGLTQVIDYTPSDVADVQTALSTTFLNTTSQAGSSFEYMIFNMYSPKDPGYYLPFRQAIAHLINYTYISDTVLDNGLEGIATPALFLPSAFGSYVPSNFTVYQNSLALANQSLAADPQIAYSATDKQPSASNTIACTGATGVWEYATSVGSGKPNGTAFTPDYITRPDHATWFTFAQNLWQAAATIGLCLNLQQVVHYSSVYPIVYAAYSDNWGMYDGGSSYSGTLDPVFNSYFPFTAAGFPAGPLVNPSHFDNATITQYLRNAYTTANATYSEEQATQGIALLQQQIPWVNLWWDNWIIASLNNFNGNYWSGYVNVPAYSTWSSAGAFYQGLSVHRVDPSTGKTIVGGTFGVGQHEAPDGFNFMSDNSVYDAEIYNMLYDSAEIWTPNNPTLGGLVPWMVTGAPSFTSGLNITTPHGYHLVNGMAVTLNFLDNVTFQDNVQMTAADYNFSLWYPNLNGAAYNSTTGVCTLPCWKQYAANVAPRLTGSQPDLVDSVVNSTYTMTVYMNGSGIEDYVGATGANVFPQHLWSQVNSTYFNVNDAGLSQGTGTVNGISLLAGTGPFYFGQYVPNQYTIIYRNPGYFRTDIWDWSMNGTAGSSVPVSFNITQMGTPIPSSASVKAWLLQKGSPISSTSTPLSLSGGSWTGSIPTSSLSAGFYEIVVNGSYTDSNGLSHTALQFWGLNLAQGSSVTSSTTSAPPTTSATGTTTSSTSPTSSASSTTSTSTSSSQVSSSSTTSSTSTGGNSTTLIAAGVIVVIIIIAGVAVVMMRRPRAKAGPTT